MDDYGPSHFAAERSWWVLVPRETERERERETERQRQTDRDRLRQRDKDRDRENVCVRQTYIQRRRHSSFELFMC